MSWILGAAGLSAVVLLVLGWNWQYRRVLAVVCALFAGVLVGFIPFGAVMGALFGMSKGAETSLALNLIVLGPLYFAPAFALVTTLLIPNPRVRLNVLAIVVSLLSLLILLLSVG